MSYNFLKIVDVFVRSILTNSAFLFTVEKSRIQLMIQDQLLIDRVEVQAVGHRPVMVPTPLPKHFFGDEKREISNQKIWELSVK